MIYGILAAAGLIVGFVLHVVFVKVAGSKSIASANKMKHDAEREAERLLREARVTAKSDVLKIKEDFENEMKERRREIQSSERRLAQKEENLDRKADSFESKVRNLERKERDIDALKDRLSAKEEEMKKAVARQIDELERITELDRESAKNLLLEKLRGEVENECGILIRNIVDEAKQKAERESQRLLVYAIQRYAGECTYERTTATIPLPSDEMKGRIIGREGRNIRALEAATGVNILIDDTPEAVVISCFDPIRKEIARRLLEKLISDGRIHPTRIEDLIKKIRKEIDEEVFDAGEKAVLDCGVQGVPKPIINLLGRLQFRFSFSQNVLKHSIETAAFMGAIAAELGLETCRAFLDGPAASEIPNDADGLLLLYTPHIDWGHPLLRMRRLRKIMLNNVFPDMHCVLCGNHAGMAALLDHLAAKGVRSVCFCGGLFCDLGLANLCERTEAFRIEAERRRLAWSVREDGDCGRLLRLLADPAASPGARPAAASTSSPAVCCCPTPAIKSDSS